MLPSVRTYMDSDTYSFSTTDDIHEALNHLIDEGITGSPVVDTGGQLVGMLSEYECLRLLTHGDGTIGGTVADYMEPSFQAITPDMDVYYVAGLFLADPVHRRFPVVEGQRLVGVITRKDILRAVQRAFKA